MDCSVCTDQLPVRYMAASSWAKRRVASLLETDAASGQVCAST